jgi:hypothetical protein
VSPWYVEWQPEAEQELYASWLRADDPGSITTAESQVNDLLSQDPFSSGRYLSEGLYAIEAKSLVVYYTILSTVRSVKVTWVRVRSA